MSATTIANSEAVAEWVKLFPKTVTENYTSSVNFMRQLTVVAISTIAYVKGVVRDDSFQIETLGGCKINVLKKKCDDEMAQFISTSLTQAFDAFNKKYLHKLALCFYEGEYKAENLVEYYVFEYSYNPGGISMEFRSKSQSVTSKHTSQCSFDEVRMNTVTLIKACLVMAQTSRGVSASFDVAIQLYYNDKAPEDYQAPGFLTSFEDEDHLDGPVADSLTLGSVKTKYHRVVLRSFTKDYYRESSNEAIASQNIPMITPNDDDDFGALESVQSRMVEEESRSEIVVNCLCGSYDPNDYDAKLTIKCNYCNTYQHGSCYGVCRTDLSRVAYHCCVDCYDEDPTREPSDPKLAASSFKKRKCTSLFRRTLDWCQLVPTISIADLVEKFRLSQLTAVHLMKILVDMSVVKPEPDANPKTPRAIIPKNLKAMILKHFRVDIVQTLVDESLSQNKFDPVEDALGGIETISLQNASTIGQIVEVNKTTAPEDATLRQYRDALELDKNNGDELPLSGSHNPIQNIESIGKKGIKRKTTSYKYSKTEIETKKKKKAAK